MGEFNRLQENEAIATSDVKRCDADFASTILSSTDGLNEALVALEDSIININKTDLGLDQVDNTSDLNKPISTATQTALNSKENTITAGTTGQYWRGDKSWQTLDKSAVGLSNVDNTSDLNKPISTATQTALNGKLNTSDITQTITDGVTNKTPSEDAVFDRVKNYRTQGAGGVVSPGINVIVGDINNAIASDIGDATISGGGTSGRENVIGGSVLNVNTGTSNTVQIGTQADYSVITGGYDNVASGLMSVISGAHNYTKKESTHGTIGGGSVQKIDAGDYNTITGGTSNTIDTSGGAANTISGRDNSITGSISRATIGGGGSNSVTGTHGTISGGLSNSVTAEKGVIAGGGSNSVTAYGAFIGGGESNLAEGQYSVCEGVQAKSRLQGQKAHSSGRFSTVGDAQGSTYILRRQTSTNASFQLRVDGGAGYLTIPDDTTWGFSGIVVARRTDADNESAAYKVEGCIDHNAGTVALVGTPTVTILGEDTAAWDVTISADNTNKVLAINVFGENSKTIRWVCKLEVAEVTG